MDAARRSEEADTEHAFLDAAERLFAERGFEGAKVRAIAEIAGANLGALHYYWGSKEELFRAVWRRRLDSVQKVRNDRLDALKAKAAEGGLTVEQVLTAMVETSFGVGAAEPHSGYFQQLYGRALSDPSPAVRKVVDEYLQERVARFAGLMALACPGLDPRRLYWGVHAVFGAMLSVHTDAGRTNQAFRLPAEDVDLAAGAPALICFLSAGFEALVANR